MKSSTIILITAVVLFFGVLTIYDTALKASYLTGKYKQRFNEHSFTKIKDINELQIKAANLIVIAVESGEEGGYGVGYRNGLKYSREEGVWISDRLKGKVEIHLEGNVLTIDLVDKDLLVGFGEDDLVVVINSLKKLQTFSHDIKKTDEIDYARGMIDISGLKANDFEMVIGKGMSVTFEAVKFGNLKASIEGEGPSSKLNIGEGNKIGYADFNIKGTSSLELDNPDITKAHYVLSDSCSVHVTGKIAKQFNN